MSNLSYRVAVGALRLVAETATPGYLASVGVQERSFEKLTQDVPWRLDDRMLCKNTLSSLLTATLDATGLAHFQLPAEYIAATIAVFVKPCNCMVACKFMERLVSAEEIIREREVESVSAAKMFSLMVQLYRAEERNIAIELFEKKSRLIVRNIENTKGGEKVGKS